MQGALDKVSEITIIDLKDNKAGGTGSFKCPKDFDYAAKLDEAVAGGNTHLKGWKAE